jgi:hypothetical protein
MRNGACRRTTVQRSAVVAFLERNCGLFDEKPVQNLTAMQPHGQQGAVGFFIPASTNWCDGKLHDLRCRLLGTKTVLPDRPVLAQFGSSGLSITH